MGQGLHGSARTTAAVRRTRQHRHERRNTRAARDDIHPQTVAPWKRRESVHAAPMGPQAPRATVLTTAQEALGVAFRRPPLLPLADGLEALPDSLPTLTRSTVHRGDQRQGISRLPEGAGTKPATSPFQKEPRGDGHLDMAAGQTEDGRRPRSGAHVGCCRAACDGHTPARGPLPARAHRRRARHDPPGVDGSRHAVHSADPRPSRGRPARRRAASGRLLPSPCRR